MSGKMLKQNAIRSQNAKLKCCKFSTPQKREIKMQRKISVLQYPLISGNLPAYDLPCRASHLFRVIAYRSLAGLARFPCATGQMRCVVRQLQHFGVLYWSNTLRIWPKMRTHLVKRCAFGQMQRVLPIGQTVWVNTMSALVAGVRVAKAYLNYCQNNLVFNFNENL